MPDTSDDHFPEQWQTWLRDYAAAAASFTKEEAIAVENDEEREVVALKLALYARALTIFSTTLLLIEHDRQLDMRIHSRGVIEATMYLIALDQQPSLIDRMKDDDYRSRHSRASLHLNAADLKVSDTTRKMLEEFVATGNQGAKALPVGSLLDGSQFERLYRSFRDVSGDASHVSISSLNRHYVENPPDQSARLIVHPSLDTDELRATVTDMAISMILATLMIMKIKSQTDLWDEFSDLTARYRQLISDGRAQAPQETQPHPSS